MNEEKNINSLNLNDIVKVRLTEHGIKVYDKFYSDFGMTTPEIENNLLKTELWCLFSIFGNHLTSSCELPFIDDKIMIR